jgi:transketolase
MSNSEHLATVMVNAFIDAVDRGVDLVPVVADSTSTAKISRLSRNSLAGW